MRIKMLRNVFGAWTAKIGDEVDRPDAEAKRLINNGFAIQVKVKPDQASARRKPVK